MYPTIVIRDTRPDAINIFAQINVGIVPLFSVGTLFLKNLYPIINQMHKLIRNKIIYQIIVLCKYSKKNFHLFLLVVIALKSALFILSLCSV